MRERVLVAGASGAIGSRVVEQLKARGYRVHALTRSARTADELRRIVDVVTVADAMRVASLSGVCDQVDGVVSCVGASVAPTLAGRAPFSRVDEQANRHLLAAAERGGVSRFVYVSVFVADGYAHTRYVQAHERFVEVLRASTLSHGVVRPTGVFRVLADLVGMARSGRVPLVGDGTARTNPVHEDDVAGACVATLEGSGAEVPCGGPDTLSRREIGELAFAAVRRAPRFARIPRGAMLGIGRGIGALHPRMGELLEFAACVATTDAVAPVRGTRRLADYFADVARGGPD